MTIIPLLMEMEAKSTGNMIDIVVHSMVHSCNQLDFACNSIHIGCLSHQDKLRKQAYPGYHVLESRIAVLCP